MGASPGGWERLFDESNLSSHGMKKERFGFSSGRQSYRRKALKTVLFPSRKHGSEGGKTNAFPDPDPGGGRIK
jgi:hypothetical protein